MDDELLEFAILAEDHEFVASLIGLTGRNTDPVHSDWPRLDLDALTEAELLKRFRFTLEDIYRLKNLLLLPDEMTFSNRCKATGEEALCLLLRRLTYPCRYADLLPIFGRSFGAMSVIFNETLDYVWDRFAHLLTDMDQSWLDATSLASYSAAIHAKGAPLNNCFGFIDGTVRAIDRPSGQIQRACFNGHKRFHGIKFQSIALPNGLIGNLFGPMEGCRHDCALLHESNLWKNCRKISNCLKIPRLANGQPNCVYGDPAYPIHPQLQSPFGPHARLTADQRRFNILPCLVCVKVLNGTLAKSCNILHL